MTISEAPGLVKPQGTETHCPAIALVVNDPAPKPPAGISKKAVMAALGKEGWKWVWDYKRWAEEGQSRNAATKAACEAGK